MNRIIAGVLFVPSFEGVSPGIWNIYGATYTNVNDATGGGAYDLTPNFVLYVPASDINTAIPLSGISHRYKITAINVLDAYTIDATIQWDEEGTEEPPTDTVTNGSLCIITERGNGIGLGATVSQQVYAELAPGFDLSSLVVDAKNYIDKNVPEAPSDGKQYVRENATWTELAATETSTRAKQVVDDYVAKYSLETYKIVTTDETEKILPANPHNDVHADRVIGMTVEPIAENNIGKVLEVGAIEDLTWTWNINTLVYLGENGTMTQIAPTSGNLVVLAKPLSPTKILFNPQAPIWIAPA